METSSVPDNHEVPISDAIISTLGQTTVPKPETIVHPKHEAKLWMEKGRYVDLASLKEFGKLPASTETLPVPDDLVDVITTNPKSLGIDTLNNTTEAPIWQKKILNVVRSFCAGTPDGRKIIEDLNITSLAHLTPHQAAGLSTRLVQALSKYSYVDLESRGKTRADKSTAMELLQEGLERRDNPSWQGNGVCRNIACNTVAVFESLKANQGEDSLLKNTYCSYDFGMMGDGYEHKRKEIPRSYKIGNRPNIEGHAWNRFAQIIDDKGSAEVTIVDATWSIGRDSEVSLDRTLERGGRLLRKLSEGIEDRESAFINLSSYYDRLAYHGLRNDDLGNVDLRNFAMTEYLKIAQEFPDGIDGFGVPKMIMGVAYRIRDRLDPLELRILLDHCQAGDDLEIEENRLQSIIHGQIEGDSLLGISHKADRLVFRDKPELQDLVLKSFSDKELLDLASASGAFRVALRSGRPDLLPSFDPSTSADDASELRALIAETGMNVFGATARETAKRIALNLLRSAGNDQSIVDALLAARSDYDIIKNARELSIHAILLSQSKD